MLAILDALERLEAVAESPAGDLAEDEAFHLAVMQATHNSVIVTFGQLVRLQFHGKDPRPDSVEHRHITNQEHRRIYEAIERQDRAAARDAMYAHVMGQLKSCNLAEGKDSTTC